MLRLGIKFILFGGYKAANAYVVAWKVVALENIRGGMAKMEFRMVRSKRLLMPTLFAVGSRAQASMLALV